MKPCTTGAALLLLINKQLVWLEVSKLQYGHTGHSIPNQQKKIQTPFDFHEIWHKHGPFQETFFTPKFGSFHWSPFKL